MTTFLQDDSGTATSKPVELYEFTNALGTVVRRTSNYRDVVFGGNTYTATAGLKRGPSKAEPSENPEEMTVEMPVSDTVIDAYAGAGVAPQKFKVNVFRVQRTSGLSEGIFLGFVRSCDITSEMKAVFTISQATEDGMTTAIPNVIVSRLCNHVLYDSLCTVSRAANKQDTVITAISGRLVTVTAGGALSATFGAFGDCLHVVSGERRSISAQTGTGPAGIVLTLDVPLPSRGPLAAVAGVGQVLSIFRGCNRTPEECRDKFSNIVNFGGHRQMQYGNRSWPPNMEDLKPSQGGS